MMESAESGEGIDLGSQCARNCRRATNWRVLGEPGVRPVFVVQVDNLIPIVRNWGRFVIRGIHGMGVLSGFMEHW